jgi:hypothetical protein
VGRSFERFGLCASRRLLLSWKIRDGSDIQSVAQESRLVSHIDNLFAQPYCSFCCKGARVEFRPQSQWQVFDDSGRRKYLNANERSRFLAAAIDARADIRALCFVLAFTGCRVSEA